MGIISKKDVEHVAKLAKLKLSKVEIDSYSKQLSEIIAFVKELEEVDTTKVKATSQTTGLENVTRKDEISSEELLAQKEALSGSEKIHNGYFVVSAVFESKDE